MKKKLLHPRASQLPEASVFLILLSKSHLCLYFHGKILKHVMKVSDAFLQFKNLIMPRLNLI